MLWADRELQARDEHALSRDRASAALDMKLRRGPPGPASDSLRQPLRKTHLKAREEVSGTVSEQRKAEV